MRNVIIGTAGHIDHGKSSLIQALTGIDPDRLPEEKERGLTIDLGFAFLDLLNGQRVGIVDVPGHERFVKNMLAGASGIDLALLVVAADDGVMPQTLEHLEIVDLLGIRSGIIAVTKIDLVDEEWLELVRDDIAANVKGTVLESAPVVEVSSVTGKGTEEVRSALQVAAQQASERPAAGFFRLPIDRAFTMSGFGCVVTGSVISGEARVGDEVELLPPGETARIRGIEVHEEKMETAQAGQRVAINLSGLKVADVHRGCQLAMPGRFAPTLMVDASLRLLPSVKRALENRTRVRFHIGTSEVMARVALIDTETLAPGGTALVQFRLETPVVAARGDRYVIRSYSPPRTIGGGVAFRAVVRKRRRFRKEDLAALEVWATGTEIDIVEQVYREGKLKLLSTEQVAQATNMLTTDAERLTEELLAQNRLLRMGDEITPMILHPDAIGETEARVETTLERFHAQNPLKAGLDESEILSRMPKGTERRVLARLLARMAETGKLQHTGARFALSGFSIALSDSNQALADTIEQQFIENKYTPPSREEALTAANAALPDGGKVFDALVQMGTLAEIAPQLYFHASALDDIKRQVVAFLEQNGEMAVGDLRNLLDTSRKYAVPLMEYFDKGRVTKRVGDKRVLA